MLEQVEQIARDRSALGVERIVMKIGPLSGVEEDLLKRAFDIACAGTLADGATLEIETAPILVTCEQCGAQTVARPNRLLCGQCGDWHTRLISGDEMQLLRLDLSLDENAKEDAPCARSVAVT
jgi:hydrogenase nickel incorporation protein HypA/HybF